MNNRFKKLKKNFFGDWFYTCITTQMHLVTLITLPLKHFMFHRHGLKIFPSFFNVIFPCGYLAEKNKDDNVMDTTFFGGSKTYSSFEQH